MTCELYLFNSISVFQTIVVQARNILVTVVIYFRVKKALPKKYQKRTEASLVTALVSATVATLICYPLDTVRRQMQMKGSPYTPVLDAIPGDML